MLWSAGIEDFVMDNAYVGVLECKVGESAFVIMYSLSALFSLVTSSALLFLPVAEVCSFSGFIVATTA